LDADGFYSYSLALSKATWDSEIKGPVVGISIYIISSDFYAAPTFLNSFVIAADVSNQETNLSKVSSLALNGNGTRSYDIKGVVLDCNSTAKKQLRGFTQLPFVSKDGGAPAIPGIFVPPSTGVDFSLSFEITSIPTNASIIVVLHGTDSTMARSQWLDKSSPVGKALGTNRKKM
jgi:hypothetical protein